MTTDKEDSEPNQFKKFDVGKPKWYRWSSMTLVSAKLKGFKHAFMKEMKPCGNVTFAKTMEDTFMKIYKMNNCTHQFLFMILDGIAFGLVDQAKDNNHKYGYAFLA